MTWKHLLFTLLAASILAAGLPACGDDDDNDDSDTDTDTDTDSDTGSDTDTDTDSDSDTDTDTDADDNTDAETALRGIMNARRSTDYFAPYGTDPISVEDVKAIAWAAQGITLPDVQTNWPDVLGLRTTPSAGATYPMEVYIVAENVMGLDQGAYRYVPFDDTLESTGVTGPLAEAIAQIRIDENPSSQPFVFSKAAAIFILADVHQRTSDKYGSQAELYIAIEAGHIAQNILLMATARNLAHRPWGAFTSAGRAEIAELLGFGEDELVDGATKPRYFQPSTTGATHWPLYFIGIGSPP